VPYIILLVADGSLLYPVVPLNHKSSGLKQRVRGVSTTGIVPPLSPPVSPPSVSPEIISTNLISSSP